MPKAIVTGATGFIGQSLVEHLVANSWDVVPMSRSPGEVASESVLEVDVTDTAAMLGMASEVGQVDAFFHLAAEVPSSFDHSETRGTFVPNVTGTLNALELARACDSSVFTLASSSYIYGDEKTKIHDMILEEPKNLYTVSKVVEEVLCRHYKSQNLMNTFALRVSAPYGPRNESNNVMNTFIRRALRGKPLQLFGSGRRKQDFTYIDDVVRAFIATYKSRNNARVIYDIASGRPVSMEELANLVLDVCPDTTSEIVHTGDPDPQEQYRPEHDIEKARNELCFEPSVDLRAGIRACCDAARSDQRI